MENNLAVIETIKGLLSYCRPNTGLYVGIYKDLSAVLCTMLVYRSMTDGGYERPVLYISELHSPEQMDLLLDIVRRSPPALPMIEDERIAKEWKSRISRRRKTFGSGPGRPLSTDRCPCEKYTRYTAKSINHKCSPPMYPMNEEMRSLQWTAMLKAEHGLT